MPQPLPLGCGISMTGAKRSPPRTLKRSVPRSVNTSAQQIERNDMPSLDQTAEEIATDLMAKLKSGALKKIGIEEINEASGPHNRLLIQKVLRRVVEKVG